MVKLTAKQKSDLKLSLERWVLRDNGLGSTSGSYADILCLTVRKPEDKYLAEFKVRMGVQDGSGYDKTFWYEDVEVDLPMEA